MRGIESVFMHACIHTYIHTCIHTCMHACVHTYIQYNCPFLLIHASHHFCDVTFLQRGSEHVWREGMTSHPPWLARMAG